MQADGLSCKQLTKAYRKLADACRHDIHAPGGNGSPSLLELLPATGMVQAVRRPIRELEHIGTMRFATILPEYFTRVTKALQVPVGRLIKGMCTVYADSLPPGRHVLIEDDWTKAGGCISKSNFLGTFHANLSGYSTVSTSGGEDRGSTSYATSNSDATNLSTSGDLSHTCSRTFLTLRPRRSIIFLRVRRAASVRNIFEDQ